MIDHAQLTVWHMKQKSMHCMSASIVSGQHSSVPLLLHYSFALPSPGVHLLAQFTGFAFLSSIAVLLTPSCLFAVQVCSASDYETWNPPGNDQCLLGQKITLQRRKPTSNCFNDKRWARAGATYSPCECEHVRTIIALPSYSADCSRNRDFQSTRKTSLCYPSKQGLAHVRYPRH